MSIINKAVSYVDEYQNKLDDEQTKEYEKKSKWSIETLKEKIKEIKSLEEKEVSEVSKNLEEFGKFALGKIWVKESFDTELTRLKELSTALAASVAQIKEIKKDVQEKIKEEKDKAQWIFAKSGERINGQRKARNDMDNKDWKKRGIAAGISVTWIGLIVWAWVGISRFFSKDKRAERKARRQKKRARKKAEKNKTTTNDNTNDDAPDTTGTE